MSAQPSSPLSCVSNRKLLIAIFAILAFQAAIHSTNLSTYNNSSLSTFANEPLLTTPDGYFYLRYAREWQQDIYNSTPELRIVPKSAHAPPLSILTAAISSASSISLEKTAFYLAPILASTIFIITIWSGFALRNGLLPAVVCSLFTAAVPVWYARTRLGYFDTDGLNLTLFWLIALCLYQADNAKRTSMFFWLAGALGATLLLHYWWPQAGIPFAGIMWGTYAASACFPSNSNARKFKIALLLLGAAFIGWTLFGVLEIIPSPLKEIMASLRSHIALTADTQPSIFTGTGNTIAELLPLSLNALPKQLAGHWALLCFAIPGAAAAWRKNALLCFYFLLPSTILVTASLTSGIRFLMFVAPAFGLFSCAFLNYALEQKKISSTPAIKWAVTTAFLCLLIFPVTVDAQKKLASTYNHNKAVLANVVQKQAGPNAKVWNWWSPGYFLQYYGNRFTQIDGGLQAPERTFIAALPLATQDPLLARNWIKLFSDKPHALSFITRYTGSKAISVAFLKKALTSPQNLEEYLQAYSLPGNFDWKSWLFPQIETYLVLFSDMLLRNTWLPRGLWNPETQNSPETPMVSFSLSQVRIDQQKGRVNFTSQSHLPFSRMYYVTPSSLSHDRFNQAGVIGIFLQDSPKGFAIEKQYFDAMAFKLLFVYPSKTPGFSPLMYNPFIGGVWRVS